MVREAKAGPDLSRELFESVALSGEEFVEFLTLPAYERLEDSSSAERRRLALAA